MIPYFPLVAVLISPSSEQQGQHVCTGFAEWTESKTDPTGYRYATTTFRRQLGFNRRGEYLIEQNPICLCPKKSRPSRFIRHLWRTLTITVRAILRVVLRPPTVRHCDHESRPKRVKTIRGFHSTCHSVPVVTWPRNSTTPGLQSRFVNWHMSSG